MPQGSPLSPLLSNIMLHELDKELDKRGHRYVRYADDFSIYTKSKKAARRVGNSLYLFLKNKMKLPISREKSGIRKPFQFKILGHQFVPTYKKGEVGKYQVVVSEKKWKTLKTELKTDHAENCSTYFRPTCCLTQNRSPGMDQLLPYGKYAS